MANYMHNKKKILFITRKYPPSVGGMENGLYNIAKNLPNEEYDIKVLALGKSQKHLIWFFPYIILYVLFNARKYDCLLLGDGLICVCGRVARWVSKRIKRVIILHGLDVTFENSIYQMYLRNNLPKAADIYTCNSSYTESIAKKWGITKDVCTVRHGIDINKFENITIIGDNEFRKKYDIDKNDLVILTVGRLVKRKGVEWFIRNVLPQTSNVTYIVIGEGEERRNIENAIDESKMNNRVKLLGHVSEQELNDCYMNSDVFVMPNFHVNDNAEGFGLVAVEASLAGLVVLAANVDGIPEAIIHGKNGFLIESKDVDTYLNFISDIQTNIGKYRKIADEYREYTKKNYSWENTCVQLRAIYQRLSVE